MNKCSPVETRKNMMAAELFARTGIDFVPIPAFNEAHKKELIEKMKEIMTELENENE
jgi:hypothetical protein